LNDPPARSTALWLGLSYPGRQDFINAQQHVPALMALHSHQHMIKFFRRIKILVHGIFSTVKKKLR